MTKTRKPTQRKRAATKRKAVAASKTAIVFDLLCRPEGATMPEIRQATGWKALSVPHFAEQKGLKLKTKQEDGRMRYFGHAS